MTWFKTDDVFWRHRKVRKLGRDKLPAIGLWLLAGSWCADNIDENLTDGFVPAETVEAWDPRLRYAKRLVDAGLWHDAEFDGERGFQFHDWPDYQKTREQVEAEREEWRQKKRTSRRNKKSPGDTPGDTTKDTPGDSPKESRESPGTRSRTSLGASGQGDVPVPNVGATPRPLDRCDEHRDDPHPPPCGKCADARRATEAWNARQQAERERIADELEQARRDRGMDCEHGTPAGRYRTADGWSPCPQCRASANREAS